MPLKDYNCAITLLDTVSYHSLEEAKEATKEWADEVAVSEMCQVADVKVEEAE